MSLEKGGKPRPMFTTTQLAIVVAGDMAGATLVLAGVLAGSSPLLVAGIVLMAVAALGAAGIALARPPAAGPKRRS